MTKSKDVLYKLCWFHVISILAVFIMGFLLVWTAGAQAAEVTLAWDANSEPDLAGYCIFYRPVGGVYDYAAPTWQGPETTCKVEVAQDGYFVARAFDEHGNESGDSNEVFEGRITGPEDPGGLLISAIDLAIKALEKLREAVSVLDLSPE